MDALKQVERRGVKALQKVEARLSKAIAEEARKRKKAHPSRGSPSSSCTDAVASPHHPEGKQTSLSGVPRGTDLKYAPAGDGSEEEDAPKSALLFFSPLAERVQCVEKELNAWRPLLSQCLSSSRSPPRASLPQETAAAYAFSTAVPPPTLWEGRAGKREEKGRSRSWSGCSGGDPSGRAGAGGGGGVLDGSDHLPGLSSTVSGTSTGPSTGPPWEGGGAPSPILAAMPGRVVEVRSPSLMENGEERIDGGGRRRGSRDLGRGETKRREVCLFSSSPTTPIPVTGNAWETSSSLCSQTTEHVRRLLVTHQALVDSLVRQKCEALEGKWESQWLTAVQRADGAKSEVHSLRNEVRRAFLEWGRLLDLASPLGKI